MTAIVFAVTHAGAGCDWSLHRMQDQPRCASHRATALLEGGACDLEPPVGAVELGDAGSAVPRPPRSLAELDRGADRFARFCAPCHGDAGDGDSAISRAMTLRRPPTLIDATVTGFSDERVFAVITEGYGVMPRYAGELVPADRWAIVDYVRALQHRVVALDALTPAQRAEAMRWLR